MTIHCSHCGATLPAHTLYCGTCGASLTVQERRARGLAHDAAARSPGNAYTDEQEQVPTLPAPPLYNAPIGKSGEIHSDEQADLSTLPAALPSDAPCGDWGKAQTDEQAHLSTLPAVSEHALPNAAHPVLPEQPTPSPVRPSSSVYPPVQAAIQIPSAYLPTQVTPPALPPYPPFQVTPSTSLAYPPPQRAQPAPAFSVPHGAHAAPAFPGRPAAQPPAGETIASRWQGMSPGMLLLLGLLAIMLLLGSVLIGIGIGETRPTGGQIQGVTPTATPDPAHLYLQITAQTPAIADSLLNGPASLWSVGEKPPGGCEFASDGLHVHISQPQRVFSCTSGRGSFSNFAFQVEMRILAGDGGGMLFRGDTRAGNYYYLDVSASGIWRIFLRQKDQMAAELGEGTVLSPSRSGGQAKNTLTVIARGIQMYLYINQRFATSVQDATYTAGELGVLASETTAQTTVVYTNARIWRL